ncbi:hypothetical protein NPIL_307211 [Nephila pilipes]|uniref:Uncharacterized protein n=1 Tax=Nephila pilipes TaxID=299642 RepID=A0A8X6NXZ0_NEPPI|nr:hypothetical protein NPIL_307211 [Nephila pilipes]
MRRDCVRRGPLTVIVSRRDGHRERKQATGSQDVFQGSSGMRLNERKDPIRSEEGEESPRSHLITDWRSDQRKREHGSGRKEDQRGGENEPRSLITLLPCVPIESQTVDGRDHSVAAAGRTSGTDDGSGCAPPDRGENHVILLWLLSGELPDKAQHMRALIQVLAFSTCRWVPQIRTSPVMRTGPESWDCAGGEESPPAKSKIFPGLSHALNIDRSGRRVGQVAWNFSIHHRPLPHAPRSRSFSTF